MATLQNIGKLKYRGKDGQWHPLPVVVQDAGGGVSTISGKGQPTESTVGRLNQLYRDESTDKLYICTGVEGGYTWAAVVSDTEDAVTYTAQTLTNAQKTQARSNIGAGTSNFSGSYNDLTNKPNIPAASVIDTTLTKSGQAADAKAAGDAIGKKIDAPQVAQVGEVLTVEEVDSNGKPKKWKTAPAAAEQKQADWAQNDETAADYVKNRSGGYFTAQNSIITLGSFETKRILVSAPKSSDAVSISLSVDSVFRTINLTNEEDDLYSGEEESSGIRLQLYVKNTEYAYLTINNSQVSHTIELTELVPQEFDSTFIPREVWRNIVFMPDGSDQFSGEELTSMKKMMGIVQVTKSYDDPEERNYVVARLGGSLFVPGRFMTTEHKSINIDSSLETQTIDDFVDTFGWIELDIIDTKEYNAYTIMMHVASPTGDVYIDSKHYYLCAQATAYISGHLFVFEAYRYAYKHEKQHSTLTIKRIL